MAVVGGGPAGIQALLTLCGRGHGVTLYEKGGRLGGSLVYAVHSTYKQDLKDYPAYLVHQAEKAPCRRPWPTRCAAAPPKQKYL